MKRVKLLKTLIKLARVKHWLKNFLIFLPLIFSGSLTNLKLFALTLIAFFLFLMYQFIYRYRSSKCSYKLEKAPKFFKSRYFLFYFLDFF